MMRRLSRRELLGLGAAAGVVAASGASGGDLPERGGSLRLGLTGRGIGAFDGRRSFDPIMRIAGHGAVFDCLTEIGADGALRGELATSWEAGPDARVWTIRLREDAVFHDGRPFGADDVVATLRLHRAAGAGLGARIAQVRRLGPHEVQIVLREANPALPFLLADPQLIMLPAHAPEAAMVAGNGTGLYRMEPGATEARAVLRRVERHWRDGQAGWFDRVEILTIRDPKARFEALKAGRVDAVNMADPAWEAEARRHGRIALAEVRGPGFLEIAVEGAPPEAGRALAGAVAASLDREALLRGAFGGRGSLPAGPVAEPVAGGDSGAVAVVVAPERVPGSAVIRREVKLAARRAGLRLDDSAAARIVAYLRPGRPTADWPVSAPSGAGFAAVHPATLIAHSTRLRHASNVGLIWDMDASRIAERWWYP
jgi:peptide/nickel transport system substrate-binding protein